MSPPGIGDFQDNAPEGGERYVAFGLGKEPPHMQIIDEYGIVYQPSCLHLEEPVLITPHWLGLAFNRMGYILRGQQLHKMLVPLQHIKVGWIHAFQKDMHVLAFDARDRSEELDVYGVIVLSIMRYPIDQYEIHLNDMLNRHRSELS